MGNTTCGSRRQVDERYTRPQGLYPHGIIDEKKLRKLILDFKLAPCYPGEDELAMDLEECPICFLYYPSLNRSKCCAQSICTECFLQVKPHQTTRHVLCPFCKTTSYTVEYRGFKTRDEKRKDQIEEQKVIEAQIRLRQQEILDENERLQKRKNAATSSAIAVPTEEQYRDLCGVPSSSWTQPGQIRATSKGISCGSRNALVVQIRNGDYNLDLEEVMLMEAMWLSLQEQESRANDNNASQTFETTPSPTLSTGLVGAVADLAEHQHRLPEALPYSYVNPSLLETSNSSRPMTSELNHDGSLCRSPIRGLVAREDRQFDHWSITAERGASASSSYSDAGMMNWNVPEGFEEQMRLALAVSLAEARARARISG
ncbi:Protein SIP5 [Carex littledalei]|uniref:Protein SIP5 n=1 Tax=Carex littledalei TaxID=544730 RepID=A0A833RLA8_9POAL|nr:Protein SIP5 [Carex littledalei]